ncbi:MAG: FAD-binding protein [Clostridia bacterium]|nr:FAD-binding protein [Clostridia bacterium]
MREIVTRTAVIGSGCAGLNAADWLCTLGEDVLLVTEDMNSGTSRNTGSDKQTYYRLSLAGDDGDSVGDMAAVLNRDDVDGDIALCEAAASAQCFYRLVSLGVPFPCNEMGEYVGYQTDHSVRKRASSVGPLTSRYMTEALERSVRLKGVKVQDKTLCARILTDENGVCGLLCYDKAEGAWLRIRCAHVILATGGPAGVYLNRVYPESQFGMSGMAFEAGAAGANLHCWQYGLASVKFRWNVSGSYQQAIPRYVSVDENGTEYDFLTDSLSLEDKLHFTFLKGYQWPFDPRKVNGSSRIDLLVKAQEDLGRKVYMDFRRNPAGYDESDLSDEARDYLANCGALKATPFERLKAINAPAIQLYRDHGIDVETEMLQVSVCAQHHNGGVMVDSCWQSTVPGLYVCGEAAGTFGQFRPGGTALNSTQVGSMRAARHIADMSERAIPDQLPETELLLPVGDASSLMTELQGLMTRYAAFQRDADGIRLLLKRLDEIEAFTAPADAADPQLIDRLHLRDMMITQRQVLSAMLLEMQDDTPGVTETLHGVSRRRPSRPIPQRDLWFERVWQHQRETAARKEH